LLFVYVVEYIVHYYFIITYNQVSLKLENPVTKQREIAGLVEAMKRYKLKD